MTLKFEEITNKKTNIKNSKITITLFQHGERDVRHKKFTKLVLLHENIPKARVKSVIDNWDKHFWKKMKGNFFI